MSEYGGLAGIWEDLSKNLIVSVETYEDNSPVSDLPLVTKFTVTNGASKSDSRPEIFFEEVVLTVGVPPNLHVEKHKDLASGESFIYEHRSRYSELGKIVFSVDGAVSPEYLLRVKRAAQNTPHGESSLSLTSYVKIIKDINLHKWLKELIETLPMPAADTTQAEIEALQDRLRDAIKEIGETKKQLENISGFVIRKTDTDKIKMNQHLKLIGDYLNHTSQACSELQKMLDTYNTRTLESTRQSVVNRLSQDAIQVDQITDGLS